MKATWSIQITTNATFAELVAVLTPIGELHALRKLSRSDGYDDTRMNKMLAVMLPILRQAPDATAAQFVGPLIKAGITTKNGKEYDAESIKYYLKQAKYKILKERRGL